MPAVLDAPALEIADPPVNPFDSDAALAASNYHRRDGNRLVDDAGGGAVDPLTAAAVDGAFRGFVGDPHYPCVGAKSAVNNDSYRLAVYGDLASGDATAGLCRDLFRFRHELDGIDATFATFAAVFYESPPVDERGFEGAMWRQLQLVHDADSRHHGWDPGTSPDPADPHFSFSFAGRAFFIVGLHPAASRMSRRFPWPTLVFNAHDQFDRLREQGVMERMKRVIHRKDLELQGTPNPVLKDFGTSSEARQYSGRAVEEGWTPPFKANVDGGDGESKCPFHKLFKKRSRA